MEVKKQKIPKVKNGSDPQNRFVWLGSYFLVACLCITTYFLIRFNIFVIPARYHDVLQKLSLAGFCSVLILTISKFFEILILRKTRSRYKRYNLIQLIHLLSLVAVGFVIISFLFTNWYAAAVSLGLISLILGFALQTPISSFIGWIYIIIRNPYRISDRIQIDELRGDVIEIGYLDTTLWEFAGDYLTNDLPSGRLIRFPNSLVLQSSVINYSWKEFQYIWNEIPFHVAYESDLGFVEKTIKQVASDELGNRMDQHLIELKTLVKESPIDDMDIKDYPFISFRINPNTWVEATVTYLVPPKQAASIRSKIVKRVLEVLKKEPDKTMFPKSNAR